ncbi:MAG: hypothetical protein EBR82_59250 [Caulobacteraceae bacterium]|nr:hypothetical protein [Caulobacteraceae bacterium]
MTQTDTSIVPVNEVGAEMHKSQPPVMTVGSLLKGGKLKELQQLAGKAMSAERLIKMFAMAASRNPKLMHCTPLSVLDAMTKCAELNLMPGTLGSVYLIPYENRKTGTCECQFILGYRGMMTLARRSGEISTITADVVRNGDEFEYEHGIESKFRHRPKGIEGASPTHAWAMAKFKDGSHQLVVMSKSEINAIRGRSRAGDYGPWKTDTDEMWKKTALRRLCKYLPLEPDVEAAITGVDRAEMEFDMPATGVSEEQGQEQPAEQPKPTAVATQAAALVSKLTGEVVPPSNPATQEQGAAQGGPVAQAAAVAPPPVAGSQGSLLPPEQPGNGRRRS